MDAKQIKRLRKKLGLTQVEFARRLKVHVVTVAKWETEALSPDKWNQHQLRELEKESAA